MNKSESIAKLMPALLKAQSAMGGAKKGASNPFFKSKYADLGAVLEACKDLLNENGITILQPHAGSNVVTMLVHESGEYIGSETPIVCAKQNDPQALGSAITYARRYGLQSLLSMPAEDDDGESAMDRRSLRKGQVDDEAKEVPARRSAPAKAAAMGPVREEPKGTVSASPASAAPDRAEVNKLIAKMADVAIKQRKVTLQELKDRLKEKYSVEKKEELSDAQAAEFESYLRGVVYV